MSSVSRAFGTSSLAQDLSPQRTLLIRTPRGCYGLRYSGLLHWEATDAKIVLQFTHACVTITGRDLLKHYAARLTDDRLAELVEPQRADQFRNATDGSAGIERIAVQLVKP